MKKNFGLILALLVTSTAMGQVTTNVTPPRMINDPAPSSLTPVATNQAKAKQPKKKTSTKPAAKKPAEKAKAEVAPTPALNQPAVVSQKNIVVRGRPDINSEAVTHLKRGDTVTILEEITRAPKTDEPAKWAKIAMPEGVHVWVSTLFLDANDVVTSPKLNLRNGPGENFSVVGLLHKGDVIKPLSTKNGWKEITAPEGSYAFVAAHLLTPTEKAPAIPVVAAKPAPLTAAPEKATPTPSPVLTPAKSTVPKVENVVATPPIVVPAPVQNNPAPVGQNIAATRVPPPVEITPATPASSTGAPDTSVPPKTQGGESVLPFNPASAATNTPAPVVTPPVPTPLASTIDEDLPTKRIIQREGIVRGAVSIQSPTHFQLESIETGKLINYIHAATTNISFKKLKGRTVIVTGEEGLDERWPNIPVITVEKVEQVQ